MFSLEALMNIYNLVAQNLKKNRKRCVKTNMTKVPPKVSNVLTYTQSKSIYPAITTIYMKPNMSATIVSYNPRRQLNRKGTQSVLMIEINEHDYNVKHTCMLKC